MEFVKERKSESDKLLQWESVTRDAQPTMIFDRICELRYNFDDKLYEKIDSIFPPFNFMEMMVSDKNKIQH